MAIMEAAPRAHAPEDDAEANPRFAVDSFTELFADENTSGTEEDTAETMTNPEVSPFGSSVVRAAERVNNFLVKRQVNKAQGEGLAMNAAFDAEAAMNADHAEALTMNESESQAAYDRSYDDAVIENRNIDHAEALPMNKAFDKAERRDARQEKIEEAKKKLRGFGRSALTHLKNAGHITVELSVGVSVRAGSAGARGIKRGSDLAGDAMIAGLKRVENGMDNAGDAMAAGKSKVKENYQTYQFNRETKSNDREFKKEYAKETKAFDKNAASEAKVQAKEDKIELKEAGREDKRFERSMRKKVALERRAERRARWTSKFNSLKDTAKSGLDRAGDGMMSGFAALETGADWAGAKMVSASESAKDAAERTKASIHITRAAGRAAVDAFQSTRDAHKEQNKLY